MTEAEKAFEHYMDEIIQWAGQTGKRRLIWSIPRCTLAREVWMDCIRRQNVAGVSERDQQHSPSCS